MTQNFNFSTGLSHKRPIRRVPEKYLDSTLRPNFDISDGDRPAAVFLPHRSLNVKYKDRSTDQYVVIPKGRLVSAITQLNGKADIYVGTKDFDGDVIKIDEDENYYGVPRTTLGLLVPANGGAAATYTYAADDVLAEVPTSGADTNVAVDDTLVIAANAPVGALFYDMFQDIRGMHLNYDTFKNYGVVSKQLVQVPFIDVSALADLADVAATKFQPKGFDFDLAGTAAAYAAAAADLTGSNPAVAGDNSATHLDITDVAHGLEAGDAITISGAVAKTGSAATIAASAADLTGATPAVAGDNSATHITITAVAHELLATDVVTISGAVAGDGEEAALNVAVTVVTVIDADNFVVELAYAAVDGANAAAAIWTAAAADFAAFNAATTVVSVPDADSFIVELAILDINGADASSAIWARVDAAVTGAGYAAAEKYFTFMTLNSENAAHGVAGSFVCPDIFGNYIPQYKTLTNNYRTNQTVGRVLGLDNRFPKDLLETVEGERYESEPLARVAGASTEGLSEHLFWFAYRLLEGAGYTWPTDGTDKAKKIIAFVQAGAIGMAYIQLDVR